MRTGQFELLQCSAFDQRDRGRIRLPGSQHPAGVRDICVRLSPGAARGYFHFVLPGRGLRRGLGSFHFVFSGRGSRALSGAIFFGGVHLYSHPMFPRRVLLCLGFLCSAFLAASAAPVHFNGGSATLDGPWQFHIGDNPAWAAPDFDDSGWERLSPDKPWGAQGHRNADGFGWYRYHVTLDALQAGPDRIAVLFPSVENAYEVYWNGRLIGGNGKVPP